jgi:hypothetical protein
MRGRPQRLVVEYRIHADFKRGCGVARPNTEQDSVLMVPYLGLPQIAANATPGGTHPALTTTSP